MIHIGGQTGKNTAYTVFLFARKTVTSGNSLDVTFKS